MPADAPPRRARFLLDAGQCVSCGVCADLCPRRAIRLDGDEPLPAWTAGLCDGCGDCAVQCPTAAIRIDRQP